MSHRIARTAVPVTVDRNFPAPMFGEAVKALKASGVVDDVQLWDQLTSWWPPLLWTPENSPMASVMPDVDSFPDVFAYAAYAAALGAAAGAVEGGHARSAGRSRRRCRARSTRGTDHLPPEHAVR